MVDLSQTLLTAKDVARILRCSVPAVYQRVRRGTIPRPLRARQKQYWEISVIAAWLEGSHGDGKS
jgi:predicted DNA-binding transcriptional regulator AlpA